MTRAFCCTAIVALIACVSEAPAQTASPSGASPALALGVGALHWGMTAEEMAAVFPDMRFSAHVTNPGDPRTGVTGYQLSDCSFTLTASFYGNALDQFFLGARDASATCQTDTLQRLETAFKLRASADPFAGAAYKYLSDATTLVSYTYDSNNYLLPFIISFEPLQDITGRHATAHLPRGNDFALGLQSLHWGMSREMVKSFLPDLVFQNIEARQSYEYAGCLFNLRLSFSGDDLDWGALYAAAPNAGCREQLLQELRDTFPVLEFTGRMATLSERRANHTASAFYYDDQRGNLNVEFEATVCQSIQASVQSAVGAAIGAEVVPDPDLGCVEYPPVSLRLQERGSVGLGVHVLKDGSVSYATITAPDKSRRLNQAALRIAATRLRFKPAVMNGEAVGSDATVKMDFSVIHPIHGRP